VLTAPPGLSLPLPSFTATAPDSWQPLFDKAKAADAAGITRLIVSDHVVFGENLEAYAKPERGGIEGGKQPTGPDGVWLEPLTVLSVVCGMTERIRLGTGILLAALRRPAVLAKATATLDVLSGGRLDLGVGVGWQREEYEAAGLPFEVRGKLLDETLAVCQTLWRDLPASFSGDYLSFDKIYCVPQPVQPGGVPLWVSGTLNPRVLERIVRFGHGWIPWGPDIAAVRSGVARVHEALEVAGRETSGFAVQGWLHSRTDRSGAFDLAATMEAVPSLVADGITDLVLDAPVPDGYGAAADFLSGVVEALHEVTA
jgi:probable F420-dependent oxidoreductase